MQADFDFSRELDSLISDLERVGRVDLHRELTHEAAILGVQITHEITAQAAQVSASVPQTVQGPYLLSENSAFLIRVVSNPAPLQERHKGLPGLLEYGSKGSGGRYIRHPHRQGSGGQFVTSGAKGSSSRQRKALARESTWSNQPTHPFMWPVVLRNRALIDLRLLAAIDSTLKVLEGR